MSPNSGPSKGGYGEAIAEGYLRAKGCEILKSRYRCAYGEIDLIARDKDGILAFVEVKLRKNWKTGEAAEAVTPGKRRRIILTALHYIAAYGNGDMTYRFDVIEVWGREFYNVRHIENAFCADDIG